MAAQLFTFLVVALTLVVFRAESLTSAGRIFDAFFHWNGALFAPEYAAQLKYSRTLEFTSMMFGDGGSVSAVFVLLFLALAACWLLPSTYQLFRRCEIAIDKPMAGRDAVIGLQWQASRGWAIYIAVLAVISMLNLTQVSEFLYFQF